MLESICAWFVPSRGMSVRAASRMLQKVVPRLSRLFQHEGPENINELARTMTRWYIRRAKMHYAAMYLQEQDNSWKRVLAGEPSRDILLVHNDKKYKKYEIDNNNNKMK